MRSWPARRGGDDSIKLLGGLRCVSRFLQFLFAFGFTGRHSFLGSGDALFRSHIFRRGAAALRSKFAQVFLKLLLCWGHVTHILPVLNAAI